MAQVYYLYANGKNKICDISFYFFFIICCCFFLHTRTQTHARRVWEMAAGELLRVVFIHKETTKINVLKTYHFS